MHVSERVYFKKKAKTVRDRTCAIVVPDWPVLFDGLANFAHALSNLRSNLFDRDRSERRLSIEVRGKWLCVVVIS